MEIVPYLCLDIRLGRSRRWRCVGVGHPLTSARSWPRWRFPAPEPNAFAAFLAPLRKTRWFVYAKPTFAGPKAVLAYLSRYAHRVAILNSRLRLAADGRYKSRPFAMCTGIPTRIGQTQ